MQFGQRNPLQRLFWWFTITKLNVPLTNVWPILWDGLLEFNSSHSCQPEFTKLSKVRSPLLLLSQPFFLPRLPFGLKQCPPPYFWLIYSFANCCYSIFDILIRLYFFSFVLLTVKILVKLSIFQRVVLILHEFQNQPPSLKFSQILLASSVCWLSLLLVYLPVNRLLCKIYEGHRIETLFVVVMLLCCIRWFGILPFLCPIFAFLSLVWVIRWTPWRFSLRWWLSFNCPRWLLFLAFHQVFIGNLPSSYFQLLL